MNFEESYFNAEIRDGFSILSMVKREWAAELEVLNEIDHICKKNGIPYFAEAGTLLGTVREGGFIAWDDDIDIGLFRNDYERFIRVAAQELPKGYCIFNVRGETTGEDGVATVANSGAICTAPDFLERYHGFPYPARVDIFPFDNLPDSDEERAFYRSALSGLFGVLSILQEEDTIESCNEEKREALEQVEEIVGRKFERNKSLKVQLFGFIDCIAAMYRDVDTECVTIASYYALNGNYVFKKEWFLEKLDMQFECLHIPIPKFYDQVLREEYGEYLIPVRGTSLHNYPCFAYQERLLFEEYRRRGLPVPEVFKE